MGDQGRGMWGCGRKSPFIKREETLYIITNRPREASDKSSFLLIFFFCTAELKLLSFAF